MNIPKIALESIPGLDQATGIFGSAAQSASNYRDGIVAIMVYLYDTDPCEAHV